MENSRVHADSGNRLTRAISETLVTVCKNKAASSSPCLSYYLYPTSVFRRAPDFLQVLLHEWHDFHLHRVLHVQEALSLRTLPPVFYRTSRVHVEIRFTRYVARNRASASNPVDSSQFPQPASSLILIAEPRASRVPSALDASTPLPAVPRCHPFNNHRFPSRG